jgi:hypothetical protein
MSDSYIIQLSNGTTLGTIYPLENNGPAATSVLREISSIDVGSQTLYVAGDLSHLTNGTSLSIVGPVAYAGSYAVSTASYNATTQQTALVLTTPLNTPSYKIVGVSTGTSGTFTIQGAEAGPCIFGPGTTFTVASNSNASSNQSYTVTSTSNAGVYAVTAFDATAKTFTISGSNAAFFQAGQTLIAGANPAGTTGSFTIISATDTGSTTVISVSEPISATYGLVSLVVPTSVILVSGTIPPGTGANGVVQPQAPTVGAYATAPVISQLPTFVGGQPQYGVTWTLVGLSTTELAAYQAGCTVTANDGAVFLNTPVVISTISTSGGTTTIYAVVNGVDLPTPFVPNNAKSGTLTSPPVSVPYGSIQYVTQAFSPLQLVGKGSPYYNSTTTWGQALLDNQVHALENFANTTAPTNPLIGQLWFDTTTPSLNLYSSANTWHDIIVTTIPAQGLVDMGTHSIINVADATNPKDAVNLETADSLYIAKVGGTGTGRNGVMTGTLTMSGVADIDLVGSGSINVSGSGSLVITGPGGISVASGNVAVGTGSVTVNSGGAISVSMSSSGIVVTSTSTDQPVLNLGSNRIINVSTPQSSTDGVNKAYVDGLTNGIIWLQSIADPCLFDDSLSGPTTGSAADPADPYLAFHRSFIVAPQSYAITARTAGASGNFTVASTTSQIGVGDIIEVPGDATPYTIVNVIPGDNGTWVISGNVASNFTKGMTVIVSGNANSASNGYYTVASATNSGANTDVVVEGPILAGSQPAGTLTLNSYAVTNVAVASTTTTITVSGTVPATGGTTLLHANGAWNGLNGHLVAYNGSAWVSVLGRPVAAGDRIGVFIDPDNEDPLTTLPGGGLVGAAGSIVTIQTVSSTYTLTYSTVYHPSEPDATTVLGTYSLHFGNSYTFRGQYGSGAYGTGYRWIEFIGPSAVIDGAGLKFTGATLNIGQGSGITVLADSIELDTAYTDGQYLRLDGTSLMAGNIQINGHKVVGLASPTTSTDATNKGYVDTTFLPVAGGTMAGVLNMGSHSITNVSTPVGVADAVNKQYTDTTFLPLIGGALTGILDMSSHKIANLAAPTLSTDAATKGYIDTSVAGYLPLSGGTMTGTIDMGTTNKVINLAAPTVAGDAVNKQYTDTTFLGLAGGTLTGPLILSGDPTTNLQATTKQYVDTGLATKANDAAVVHLTGTETIIGAKTFSAATTVNAALTVAADGTNSNIQVTTTAISITGTTVSSGGASTITLVGGANSAGGGGYVSLTGGNGSTIGGNVVISGGQGSAGAGGNVTLSTGQGSTSYGQLILSAGSTADKQIILQPTGALSVGGAVPGAINQVLTSNSTAPTAGPAQWAPGAIRAPQAPATPTSFAIAAITTGANGSFAVAGDYHTYFPVGSAFTVSGNANAASNGTYIVQSVVYTAPNTVITVSTTVPAATTVSGNAAPGAPGMWFADDSYFYVFGATAWKRVALTSF